MTTWFCKECGHRTEERDGEFVKILCPYCIEEMEIEEYGNK